MRKSLTQNKTGTRALDISRKDKEKTKDNLLNSESHSDGSAGGGHHSDGHGDFDPPSLSVKNHITEMKLKTSMAVETDAAVRNDAEQAQREKTSARVAAKKRHNRVKKQFGAVISRVKVLNLLGAHMHNASDEKQSVISQDDDKASLHSAPNSISGRINGAAKSEANEKNTASELLSRTTPAALPSGLADVKSATATATATAIAVNVGSTRRSNNQGEEGDANAELSEIHRNAELYAKEAAEKSSTDSSS
eukprot:GSChrysophyteH1.ASY1.ANO1.1226.1 assembled CDS